MANFNLNKVIIGGRMTADPELRQTQTGIPVTSFTIAVNRPYASKAQEGQQQADFISVTAWRAQAEFITRYFRRGSSICVVGSIQTRSWTDQQGVKKYMTDVLVDEVHFVDSKADSPSSVVTSVPETNTYTPDAYNAEPAYSGSGVAAPKFEEINSDDDLPF